MLLITQFYKFREKHANNVQFNRMLYKLVPLCKTRTFYVL